MCCYGLATEQIEVFQHSNSAQYKHAMVTLKITTLLQIAVFILNFDHVDLNYSAMFEMLQAKWQTVQAQIGLLAYSRK